MVCLVVRIIPRARSPLMVIHWFLLAVSRPKWPIDGIKKPMVYTCYTWFIHVYTHCIPRVFMVYTSLYHPLMVSICIKDIKEPMVDPLWLSSTETAGHRPSLRHLLMIVRQQIAADGPPGRGGGGVLRGRLGGGEPLATPKRPEKKKQTWGGLCHGDV